jgi:hypothetical protein
VIGLSLFPFSEDDEAVWSQRRAWNPGARLRLRSNCVALKEVMT